MSYNKITIIGNLGNDPTLRYTSSGTPVCDFSVASNERRKDSASGEVKEETTWFRVTLWGKQAETLSEHLAKGRQVYVEGPLRLREWTDKEGTSRTTLEVNCAHLLLLDRRAEESQKSPNAFDDGEDEFSSKPEKQAVAGSNRTAKPRSKK